MYSLPGSDAMTLGSQQERKEGEILQNDAVSLSLDDEEIAVAIGNRVQNSETFWNSELNLDAKRDKAESYWLGTYFDTSKLHEGFQVPYQDNRIFVAIETLIPLALARPPQPIVMEAYDTEASRELAKSVEKWLLSKYEDLYMKGKFMMVARHLLIGYRTAVMKYRWDAEMGQLMQDGTRFGDVNVEVKRPQRVVIDAAAQDTNNIPLVGEYLTASVDELCSLYPKKKDHIYQRCGFQSGVAPDLNKRMGYVETWFDFHKRGTGESISAVAWKMQDLVLDSMKNPNWNYGGQETDQFGNTVPLNFCDKPQKPYVFFNFLNLGRYVLDDTSLTDQAMVLQDVLDKRGRQIVENADQANSGTVINSDMIKASEVAKLIGDPGEKLMVKGDVRMAADRLPTNMLPEYVMQDKLDARNEIDNIFATHGATRGEVTGNKALGQDVLSQRGDGSRIQTLGTSIEDGADRLYKGLVQMGKVFYDLPQLQRYSSPDSSTSFTEFGQQQIEPGIKVRVKSGSVAPENHESKKQETIQMMAVLDPLSIAEGLNKENPKEFAKRMMYYKVFPDKYLSEVLQIDPAGGNGVDASAMQDIQLLNSGQNVPPQPNPTKEHLATHQSFMESPDFTALPPEVQQLHMVHAQTELEAAKSAMGMGEGRPGVPNQPTGTPPPEQPQQPAPPAQTGTPPQKPGILGTIKGLIKR